jgi:hypothetical protein
VTSSCATSSLWKIPEHLLPVRSPSRALESALIGCSGTGAEIQPPIQHAGARVYIARERVRERRVWQRQAHIWDSRLRHTTIYGLNPSRSGASSARRPLPRLSPPGPKPQAAQGLGAGQAAWPRPPPGRRPESSPGNFLLTFRPAWPKRLSRMSMIATWLITLEMIASRPARVVGWRLAARAAREVRS